ncbi:hypothetical protein ACJD0Z_12815 [Flavobacteriaceae bacterium M23B6Z8]
MTDQKITIDYLLATVLAVIFTWVLHEFTHWITAESLGYESIMRMNAVFPMEGQDPTDWHKIYISASGPIITILQAILVFFLLSKRWNRLLYPFLFVPLYMRALAGLMNFINPNDEGRISQFLGLGLFTLSILVSAILFYFVYKITKQHNLKWRFNAVTTLIVMIASSILILTDQFLKIQIL